MDKSGKTILAKGLLEGYAGNGMRSSAVRAGFNLDTSDYEGSEGRYHDEWAADFNGGGQELAETKSGEKVTRVYAGGALSKDELQKLGLTKKDVIGKLISFVNGLKDATRLDRDADVTEEEWRYTYKVLKNVEEVPVVLGGEEIRYNGNLVFIHYHIISPIK